MGPFLFALFLCLGVQAQGRHEMSIWSFGSGISTLQYRPLIGHRKNQAGAAFGIGYTHFFRERLGWSIGIEWSFHAAKMEIDRLEERREATDIDGAAYEFRYVMTGYVEKQKATYVNIPFMVHYQTGGYPRFYASAGCKLGLPLEAWYDLWSVRVRSSGYYAYEDLEYTTQRFMGFGTFNNKTIRGGFGVRVACILSAEAGVRWRMRGDFSIYTGLYFDCAVNNVLREKPDGELLRHSDHTGHYDIGSVLSSQYPVDGQPQDIVTRMIPIAVGVKVRVGYVFR